MTYEDQCCRGAKCTTRRKEPNVCEAQSASDAQRFTAVRRNCYFIFINLKDYEIKDKITKYITNNKLTIKNIKRNVHSNNNK